MEELSCSWATLFFQSSNNKNDLILKLRFRLISCKILYSIIFNPLLSIKNKITSLCNRINYELNMDINSPLNYEKITTLQLHIFPSHLFNFYNVFFLETFKSINRGIPINVVQHSHMLHQSSELPFAIVNGTLIVHRKNLINLLYGIAMQPPVKFGYF